MAVYEITGPDGATYEVDAPEGATEAQVLAYARSRFGDAARAPEKDAAKTTAPKRQALSDIERFATGLADPVHGGAQLLTKVLPSGVVNAGNAVNNWLADKTGLVARLPEGGVDEAVREREKQYEGRRGPDAGVDWMRLAGNVASPTNLALGGAGAVASKASMPLKMLAGAATGAAAAATAPVTSGNFADEKTAQMATGGAFGAAAAPVFAGLSRLTSPKASTDPGIAKLRAEGVRPTVGQMLGGVASRTEEKATSLPFVGDAIRNARLLAESDLNVAVANRALAPIGKTVPKGAQGRELVGAVGSELNDAYSALLPKMTTVSDTAFENEIASLHQMVSTGSIDPNAAALFNRILDNDLVSKFRGQRALTGETMKGVESDLGAQISRLARSPDHDARLVADALSEVRDSLRSLVARNNPQHAKELSAINRGWANYKRLERAASMLGAEDGTFGAGQLQSAVKALDKTKDHRAFAQGQALMQDLSDPAKRILGSKVPDSGTAGRIFNAPNTIAGAFAGTLHPGLLVPPVVGAAAYTRPMQSLLRGAVASRPGFAQPIAGALNRTAPVLSPAGGLLGVEITD